MPLLPPPSVSIPVPVPVPVLMRRLRALRRKRDGDIYLPDLKPFVAEIGLCHGTALALWDTGYDAARELAVLLADPARVDADFLEGWVRGLDEWGLCDGFVARLVRGTPFAVGKAHEWAAREPEYERRAGFSLMAQMAWQKNDYPDKVFRDFLPLVLRYAGDDRLYVKKAVNWALRDIGKRNPALARHALRTAGQLREAGDRTMRWVGTHRMGEVAES